MNVAAPPPFNPGWDSDHAVRAQARLESTGRYCVVGAPTKPPRPAVSLSRFRKSMYCQGQSGTCWVHAPKQLFEVTANVAGLQAFSVCRRAIGYAAKQMYEGGGNMGEGGSPTDAITVMTSRGVGVAHEDLCPYTDDENTLAVAPPAAVFDDAKKSHLVAPVKVASLADVVALIDSGKPVANGYQAPTEMQDSDTFLTKYTGILGGHSQLIWGYIQPGIIDTYMYLELENWWDEIYQPLPPSVAKLVDGYEPTSPNRTTSKWVRSDVYVALCALDRGGAEHISATGVDGLTSGTVTPAVPGVDFSDAFSA